VTPTFEPAARIRPALTAWPITRPRFEALDGGDLHAFFTGGGLERAFDRAMRFRIFDALFRFGIAASSARFNVRRPRDETLGHRLCAGFSRA
jgi:hypothetical protein